MISAAHARGNRQGLGPRAEAEDRGRGSAAVGLGTCAAGKVQLPATRGRQSLLRRGVARHEASHAVAAVIVRRDPAAPGRWKPPKGRGRPPIASPSPKAAARPGLQSSDAKGLTDGITSRSPRLPLGPNPI